jgi:hypothetical protein
MIRRYLLLSPMLVLLPACAGRRPATPKAPPGAPPSRAYFGVLPCEQACKSVRTTITFFDEGRKFRMEETFQGLPEGDQTEQSAGEWAVLRGHGGDPAAEVLELTSEQFEEERYFLKVSDDELRALDRQGRELHTPENVTLKRIPAP